MGSGRHFCDWAPSRVLNLLLSLLVHICSTVYITLDIDAYRRVKRHKCQRQTLNRLRLIPINSNLPVILVPIIVEVVQ
jgi:hypothetical protein